MKHYRKFKPASTYNMTNRSNIYVYLWYRWQFRKLCKDQIFKWQVERGTIGELAQADALGVDLNTLLKAKAEYGRRKAEAFSKVCSTSPIVNIVANGI